MEKINYNYPIDGMFVKNDFDISTIEYHRPIKLCTYSINTDGKYPFLRYVLNYDGIQKLNLPVLPNFKTIMNRNILHYSKVFLSSILQVDNFEDFEKNIDFNGFYEYNNELYLFFNITNCDINIDETYSLSLCRLALIDEILNQKHICNIKIREDTIDFFTNNRFLCYLYNNKNEVYELPIVGYVGKSTPEKLNFTFTFGESAKNKLAILGPYYYFVDFYNAVEQGNWSYNKKEEYAYGKRITDNEYGRYYKGGIVRFALFIGKTKYIQNMPNDQIDNSEIKKERINDPTLDSKYEILTMRISDHDGLWAKNYDSIYLGNVDLDDGGFFKEPVLAIKDYDQQIPLSYHYIDKNKLANRFSEKYKNEDYGIM
jgi:hypothetical protein